MKYSTDNGATLYCTIVIQRDRKNQFTIKGPIHQYLISRRNVVNYIDTTKTYGKLYLLIFCMLYSIKPYKSYYMDIRLWSYDKK